jgi:iron complex outermembrane receptor protein
VLNLGAGYNRYEGKHFGEVIWAKNMSNGNIRHRYYDNDAVKTEGNAFAKAQYQFAEGFFGFADWQIRTVAYEFLGYTAELQKMPQNVSYTFFNPKAGLRYVRDAHEFYASFARANREPNRADFTNSSTVSRPEHETLNNLEAGWQTSTPKWALSANYYLMSYQNQLILTGKINDVGAYVRQNVAKSYRQGIELSAAFRLNKQWNFFANAAFSSNKILDYTEYTDEFDDNWEYVGQKAVKFAKTDIAFSPNVVAAGGLEFSPFENMTLALTNKYVGKQFLDNTSSDVRKIDAFFVSDFRLNYQMKLKKIGQANLTLLVNNLFNEMYAPNGYTYGWFQGGERTSVNYFYPQAGRNFLLGVSFRF